MKRRSSISSEDNKDFQANIYKMALDGAGFGFWDWDIASGNISFNQNCADIFGYTEKDFITDIASWKEKIHPEDKDEVISTLESLLLGDSKHFKQEYRVEVCNKGWHWLSTQGQIIESDEKGNPLRVVGIHQDIDRRKMVEMEMEKQRAFFEQLFAGSPAGIALLDYAGRIIRVNQSFIDIFSYQQWEVEGRKINDVLVPDNKHEEWQETDTLIAKHQTVVKETVRKAKDGSLIDVKVFGYPVIIKGKLEGVFAVYQDISERIREEKEIKYLSFHDQLTGLYNRRYFEHEMDRLDKNRETEIGIIVADLDYLKVINDDCGHKKGDKYIQSAARAIKEVIREGDIAARIGGDEFAIILAGINQEILKDICFRIKNIYQQKGKKSKYSFHISLGYAIKHQQDETMEEVFIRADKKMYQNKGENKATGGI